MENFLGFNSITIVAVTLLFMLQGVLIFVIMRTNKRITQFFNGKDGKSIEKVLEFEMKRMKRTENDIKELVKNVKWVESVSKKSVHKVGVTRFNPFQEGIGGDQSFCIAMLDYKDDGVVISSLHAPNGGRYKSGRYHHPVYRQCGYPRFYQTAFLASSCFPYPFSASFCPRSADHATVPVTQGPIH